MDKTVNKLEAMLAPDYVIKDLREFVGNTVLIYLQELEAEALQEELTEQKQ